METGATASGTAGPSSSSFLRFASFASALAIAGLTRRLSGLFTASGAFGVAGVVTDANVLAGRADGCGSLPPEDGDGPAVAA